MIKCGFYIENDGLKSVDCTDLRKGNPGIGGVEYATLLVAEWLSLTKDDISLTLYVRSSQNLPPSIHVNVCSDVMEALVKSVNNGDEIFVLRFEPLYLQRHLLDNSFLHKLKIVLWAHNFYSRRYLSYFDSLSFVKAIVNVGREQLDAYRDHHAFYKSTFIYNGLYVSDEPVREFGERADEVTYVGGLYPAKGVHYLTQAWPEVLSEFPDAKLNIIGSGNLQLNIADISGTELNQIQGGMQAQAGNGEIQSYLSMDLFQVVNKGNSNDAWETQLTDLNAKLNVTLQVKDEMKNQQGTYYVIREHDGAYEKLPATYDAASGTITCLLYTSPSPRD